MFRLTLLDTSKRREPTSAVIPAQQHRRRYRWRNRKLELYFDRCNRKVQQPDVLAGARLLPCRQRHFVGRLGVGGPRYGAAVGVIG